ncbi:DUF3800 domain-containing protein [Methylomonas sp. 11b]|uniref:DUF3800 domain-containing protein n=1 Tax=Methylomonas sp. 11b TaxID=1168169 RepID=UPI00047B0F00|nr:DUF3800 domain-containing protein [Methylomonas sp. 11b]
MSELFNVYCDESCHLEGDNIPVMVLGAVWCPQAISGKIARDIRAIQVKHGLKADFEIKWTKISLGKQAFYCEIVDYFFSHPDLHFRGLVVPDKSKLKHGEFAQDHNLFYYKMFFYVLRNILENGNCYHIYLDIKDTLGREKIDDLKKVLHNAHYDFDRKAIENIQHVRSYEMAQLQLTDLFIGALAYVHRGLNTNAGKLAVIDRIKQRSGKSLIYSTLPSERKFNVFVWEAS